MLTKQMNTNGKENSIHDLEVYTTGEIAMYMGVSVQTVNEWIKSGKITPVHRANNETGQWRIPTGAKVVLRNGSSYSLKEVIQEKEQISKGSKYATREEELSSIMEELAFYQGKYSNYFELLYNTNRSAEEERDLKLWLYWQQRYVDRCYNENSLEK